MKIVIDIQDNIHVNNRGIHTLEAYKSQHGANVFYIVSKEDNPQLDWNSISSALRVHHFNVVANDVIMEK